MVDNQGKANRLRATFNHSVQFEKPQRPHGFEKL